MSHMDLFPLVNNAKIIKDNSQLLREVDTGGVFRQQADGQAKHGPPENVTTACRISIYEIDVVFIALGYSNCTALYLSFSSSYLCSLDQTVLNGQHRRFRFSPAVADLVLPREPKHLSLLQLLLQLLLLEVRDHFLRRLSLVLQCYAAGNVFE